MKKRGQTPRLTKKERKKHIILKFLHRPAGHKSKQQKPWGLFMLCIAVGVSLDGVRGQQSLPKCICAKACQPALPTHSQG